MSVNSMMYITIGRSTGYIQVIQPGRFKSHRSKSKGSRPSCNERHTHSPCPHAGGKCTCKAWWPRRGRTHADEWQDTCKLCPDTARKALRWLYGRFDIHANK